MIRSSTLTVKFANADKRRRFADFIDEFRRVFKIVLDDLWTWNRISSLIDHKKFSHVDTTLSCRMMQVVLKQASAVVRGTRTSASHLHKIPSKPTVGDVCPELDYRFLKKDWSNKTSFDCFLTLGSLLKDRVPIVVPLKKTNHFNRVSSRGTMTNGCRLSKTGVTFMFETDVPLRETGSTLGVDVGITDVWSDSVGNRSQDHKHPHGWTLSKIMSRLSSRKKGSKNFKQTQSLRDNFIGWSLNRLNLDGVKELKIEDIKHMRRGKVCDRFRSHWTYPKIFCKLESKAEENGVRLSKVDPRNTSRTCSSCGAVDVLSRKGKRFQCVACGHTQDADSNAAQNISLAAAKKPQRRGACSPSGKRKSDMNGFLFV